LRHSVVFGGSRGITFILQVRKDSHEHYEVAYSYALSIALKLNTYMPTAMTLIGYCGWPGLGQYN